MTVDTGADDFDIDDLVEQVMALPISQIARLSDELNKPNFEWSFEREIADEILRLNTSQRQSFGEKLIHAASNR